MKPKIPQGGFFAVKSDCLDLNQIRSLIEEKGHQTRLFPDERVLLSVCSEFDTQGIWENQECAVVYDTNLTNINKLSGDEKTNPGQLIAERYLKKGFDSFSDLKGGFAFTLWDKVNQRLVTVTDYFGIRPVVYYYNREEFLAASRIKFIRDFANLNLSLNNEAIYHYLFFQAIPSPVTIYSEIKKLEPGKLLKNSRENFDLHTYYDISYRPDHSKTENYWKKEISNQLQRSFFHFFDSANQDNTGCFLSGGTDSSSIAGYASKYFTNPVKTFSIGFDEDAYNEISFADIASKHFNTNQHEYFVTPGDVLNLIEVLPSIYDEPFGNASVVPAFFCASLAAKNNVNVLYGGDGGDEVFGGNERYVTNLVFDAYFKIPGILRKKILEPWTAALSTIPLMFRAGRYMRRANIPNPDRFYSYNMLYEFDSEDLFKPSFLKTIDKNCFLKLSRQHFKNVDADHITDKLLYLDMKFTITDNDLRKVTQMAEAAGIQVHYPFLDKELVNFSATIPPQLKVKWGKNRYIFKESMKGFLPDSIINKSKHGMGLPVTPWFKKDKQMSQLLYDSLFYGKPKISEFLEADFLNNLKNSFEEDTKTNYYGDNLWVFLALELWMKKF